VSETEATRMDKQSERRNAITDAVMSDGSVRISDLAERFGISTMTVHRDLDELEARGLLRKNRGVATALSTVLVESSDLYRSSRNLEEKRTLARAALERIEPGQAIMIDDSTTSLQLVPHLQEKSPLTVITNTLTVMNALRAIPGITLLGLGGEYYNWCSSYMGRMTTSAISSLRADVLVMSTSAITDGVAFHQTMDTVDVKRAMFDSASTRILLADHTKFDKRALHAMQPLADFDLVIVDAATKAEHIADLRQKGVNVLVAPRTRSASRGERA